MGIFDRVDISGGSLRIVDYKTGGAHFTSKDIDSLFDADTYPQGSHIFQLLLYLLILDRQETRLFAQDDIERVMLEIYYTRSLYSGGNSWMQVTKEQYEHFKERLSELLDTILSPEVPFTACEDGKACAYCPFTAKCNR